METSGHIPGDSPKTSRPHSFASDGSKPQSITVLLVLRKLRSVPCFFSGVLAFRVLFYLILIRDPLSDNTEREQKKAWSNQTISDYRNLALRSLLGWTSVASFQFVGGLPRKAALDTDMRPHSLATYATSALGPVTTIRSYRHRSYSSRPLSLIFNSSASPVDSLKVLF